MVVAFTKWMFDTYEVGPPTRDSYKSMKIPTCRSPLAGDTRVALPLNPR
ncbi:hypothetical protein M2262_000476 [Pseudomonas sp. BIGb0408]|uniref:Uncharacterized protein n=1 Tax=Phytopseudomonas flavescens TaxID=29435 RepID=A0A7Y9XR83_9GAMM|nr:hypothetical protein [Pseudomonas sp. BIGb0408]NYH75001.1 hypothetical protein [Pseudomonas flavescens]